MASSIEKQRGLLLSTAGEAVRFELAGNRDERFQFTVYDQDGSAADLTGYSGNFRISDGINGTEVTNGSIVLSDAPNGVVYFDIGKDVFDAEIATFDRGERQRAYVIAFKLVPGAGGDYEVADSQGRVQFPFILKWSTS